MKSGAGRAAWIQVGLKCNIHVQLSNSRSAHQLGPVALVGELYHPVTSLDPPRGFVKGGLGICRWFKGQVRSAHQLGPVLGPRESHGFGRYYLRCRAKSAREFKGQDTSAWT